MAKRRIFVGERSCFWSKTTPIKEFNTVEIIIINGAQKPCRIKLYVGGHKPGNHGYQVKLLGGAATWLFSIVDDDWLNSDVMVSKSIE